MYLALPKVHHKVLQLLKQVEQAHRTARDSNVTLLEASAYQQICRLLELRRSASGGKMSGLQMLRWLRDGGSAAVRSPYTSPALRLCTLCCKADLVFVHKCPIRGLQGVDGPSLIGLQGVDGLSCLVLCRVIIRHVLSALCTRQVQCKQLTTRAGWSRAGRHIQGGFLDVQ